MITDAWEVREMDNEKTLEERINDLEHKICRLDGIDMSNQSKANRTQLWIAVLWIVSILFLVCAWKGCI